MSSLIARARLAIRGAFDGWSLGPGGSSASLVAWDASKGGSRLVKMGTTKHGFREQSATRVVAAQGARLLQK